MKILPSREGYELYAEAYRQDHPHLDSFDWAVAGPWLRQSLAEVGADQPELRIAELGCGDGRVLGRLSRWDKDRRTSCQTLPLWQLAGADLSPAMLRLAAKKARTARWLELDLTHLNWSARLIEAWGRQHLLLAFFVLVHLTDLPTFFQGVRAALNPGGRFIFNNIPQKSPPILEAQGKKFQIAAYHHSDAAVRSALAAAGLVIRRSSPVFEDRQLVSTVYEAGITEGALDQTTQPKL